MSESETNSAVPWLLGQGLDTPMKSEGRIGKQFRWFLNKGESRKGAFLTDAPDFKVFWEHNLQIGREKGSWMHYCTCVQPLGISCPICEYADCHNGRFARYKISIGTILDLTPYEKKGGGKVPYSRRIFAAKQPTIDILRRRRDSVREQGKGFKYAIFTVFRTAADNSAGAGNDFEYMGALDTTQYPPDDLKELLYDFIKPDPEKAKRMLKAAQYGDAAPPETKGPDGGKSDDIPFDAPTVKY